MGAILVYAIMVAPAAASNEVMRSVRGVMLAVFVIALFSEFAGLAASFAVHASPSAIAGIIAAMSYVIAMQIKKIRERVNGLAHLDELRGTEASPEITVLDVAEQSRHND